MCHLRGQVLAGQPRTHRAHSVSARRTSEPVDSTIRMSVRSASSVRPDPGKCTQGCKIVGEAPIMPFYNRTRTGVQVAGACIVTEALPELQHLVERCGGKRRNIGPACHESVEIWSHSRYRRLLQHDFAEPDAVGIGSHAGGGAPRQGATVVIIPQ